MKLKIEGLDFAYKAGSPVLREVTMEALPGQITALIGPNASGKSTLIKCIAGLLKASGKIMFGSRDTRDIPKAERSRLTGYLPQELPARAILTVFEAILIGRLNSLSWRVSQDDLEKAFDVLSFMGIQDLATRFLSELSGGQKQIVSIAQTLAGEPEIMLLDEPTSNLDLRHEIEVLEIIQNDTRTRNTTTIIAIHNLTLATRYADKLIVLKEGEIYSSGPLEAVISPEMIRNVYGVEAKMFRENGVFYVIPLSPSGVGLI